MHPYSIDAYHDLIRTGGLAPQCRRLLATYTKYGPLADFEVAALLGWDKSTVSARRNELMDKNAEGHCTGKGAVVEVYLDPPRRNPATGKRVGVYRANVSRQPTLIYP